MTEPTPDDAQLTAWLAEHEATCPVCAYTLRGLTDTRCPECGSRLSLTVGAADLRLGAWIVTIIGFALALGFTSITTLMIVYVFTVQGPPPTASPWIFLASMFMLAVMDAVGLLYALRLRHDLARRPFQRRWTQALLTVAAIAAVHTVYGIIFVPWIM